MIIYKITNKINGKSYIGQTIRPLKTRWIEHCAKKNRRIALSSAIRKYGRKNFTIEVVCVASSLDELNKKEIQFISEFNTLSPYGYNLKTGGNRPRYTEEVKKKMSEARLGEKHPFFGKKFSEKTRLKISEALKNKPKSLLHKTAISKANSKPIVCRETMKEYESITLAAKSLGVRPDAVWTVLNGKRKNVKGLTFYYKE